MKDTVYEMASAGASLSEISARLAAETNTSEDSIYHTLTNKGSELAIAFHLGALCYHEVAESALYDAVNTGDAKAIELLFRLREERRIQTLINDLF